MNQFLIILCLIVVAACVWVINNLDNQEKEREAHKKREKELADQKLRKEQAIAQSVKEQLDRRRLEEKQGESYYSNKLDDYPDELFIGFNDDDEDEYYEDEQDDDDDEEDSDDDDEEDSVDNNELEDLNNPHKKLIWPFIQKVMSDNEVTSFYHFTDRANLPSIKKHGICAWAFCNDNDIEITLASSSEQSRSLDRRDNLQNYARVSFTKQHPMMFISLKEGRIKDPIILEISTEVALWKHTKYSDRNAVKNGARVGDSLEDFKRIRFDLVKKAKHFDIENVEERQFYQAELLILDKIPIKYIKNINSF